MLKNLYCFLCAILTGKNYYLCVLKARLNVFLCSFMCEQPKCWMGEINEWFYSKNVLYTYCFTFFGSMYLCIKCMGA